MAKIEITFTADSATGNATVNAEMGAATDSAIVYVAEPGVSTIELSASPSDLTAEASSASLVATVRDVLGDPCPTSRCASVSATTVAQGSVDGSEVVTGTSDSNGQCIPATFAKASDASGKVVVRAEYFVEDAKINVVADDSATLLLAKSLPNRKSICRW